jgi:adenosylcobinamide-phosphate synthase
MGKTIRFAERFAPDGHAGKLAYGLGMALGLPTLWAALAFGSLQIPWIGPLLALYWLKSSLTLRVLGEAGEGVARPLVAGKLGEARKRLSWLCSRDASALTPSQLVAGVVESLAENLSDSFIAPLFWFLLGGVPAAVAYRVVNTLDAMIGYRGRYEWLGKASARLDDLLNLIPARITAFFLLLGGCFAGGDSLTGWRVLAADRAHTESPNAGWPMAAMAGLLGVVLEKPGHYRLGGAGRMPEAKDISRAWRICEAAALVAAAGAAIIALIKVIG